MYLCLSLAARRSLLAVIALLGLAGCANILAPTGGPRDTAPPKLLAVSPPDSSLVIRPATVELRFDEYVVSGADAAALTVSPLLPIAPSLKVTGRRAILSLPDTALEEGTTYRISFGGAIADLHESNPFGTYTYTFSTGTYFDSLTLTGRVVLAETAEPDSGISLFLYPGGAPDSAVLRTKPLYITRADGLGDFRFEALPSRAFRLYAVADANTDLLWSRGERFAFLDSLVAPGTASDPVPTTPIRLRSYIEGTDTAALPGEAPGNKLRFGGGRDTAAAPAATADEAKVFSYSFAQEFDTSARRRTADLNRPLTLRFTTPFDTVYAERIFLAYDSAGTTIEAPLRAERDTADSLLLHLRTPWVSDAVYNLRLLRGFATDSAGGDAPASRLRFRTLREEDYGTVQIRIPTRFYGRGYLMRVEGPAGPLYAAPVLDSTVRLRRLTPGAYRLRIVADANRNGQWDGGLYGEGRQPETVFPHRSAVPVKAGWDAVVDFVPADEGERKKEKRLPTGKGGIGAERDG